MTSDPHRVKVLLEGDGLEANGVDPSIRNQLVTNVMKDYARARRSQNVAIWAWVIHSILFALNWSVHLQEHGRAAIRLVEQPFRVSPFETTWTSSGRSSSYADLVLSTMYWSDGLAFVIAILLTLVYFIRIRGAESGIGVMNRLAKGVQ